MALQSRLHPRPGRGPVPREQASAHPVAAHRHRVPIGLVLLAQGWITHDQLKHALEAQRRARDCALASGSSPITDSTRRG